MSAASQQVGMFNALFLSTGATVTYSRGTTTFGTVRAVRGRSAFEGESGSGLRLQSETEDFLFLSSALSAINVPLPPAEGDYLTLANSRVYLLCNPPYHEMTAGVIYRTHSKRRDI